MATAWLFHDSLVRQALLSRQHSCYRVNLCHLIGLIITFHQRYWSVSPLLKRMGEKKNGASNVAGKHECEGTGRHERDIRRGQRHWLPPLPSLHALSIHLGPRPQPGRLTFSGREATPHPTLCAAPCPGSRQWQTHRAGHCSTASAGWTEPEICINSSTKSVCRGTTGFFIALLIMSFCFTNKVKP